MSQKTDILKYFSRFLYNSKLTFSPLSHKHSVSDIENLVEYTSEEKEKLKNIETGATRVIVDDTLLVSGRAADAKIVGDRIMQVEETVSEFKSIVITATDDNNGNVIVNFSFQASISDDNNGNVTVEN